MNPTINQDISDTYTEVPYHSDAFGQSSPENLQVIATLFGLTPPPIETARILELGCASGGNLMPFAARQEKSTCVGIDLVELQIQQGQDVLTTTGLNNLTLKTMSIEDIDASFGQFDYIVCHGVYSWVPSTVQEAILRVCKSNLSPNGVAYISYNTYPGWKTKEIVRDAMLLRASGGTTATDKLGRAKGMVEFLHQHARTDSVLKAILNDAVPSMGKSGEHYLIHEYLELCNAPCYFKDFLQRAMHHEMAYLGEAQPQIMFASNFGQDIAGPLMAELSHSQVELEQYLDFVVNRTFRQTLLIHAPLTSRLNYSLGNSPIDKLHYAGLFEPLESPGPDSTFVMALCNSTKLELKNAAQQAGIEALHASYPATLSFTQLVKAAQTQTKMNAKDCKAQILRLLEYLVATGAVRYRCQPVVAANQVSKKPLALSFERQKAMHYAIVPVRYPVANIWHEALILDPIEHCLLSTLDGKTDHAALTRHLIQSVNEGKIHFLNEGQPISDADEIAQRSKDSILPALQRMQRKGLLIA
jgi:methyltransferase-like protein/2-polyprenyl-3-methyl-5-hydroxy-6-metoxy-1,4-benzoquinol methylase